jgi:predicted transcriptional regulator
MSPPLVPWMTRIDRLILEVLDEAKIAAIPPKAIVFELRTRHGIDAPSESHVNRRLRNELTKHGLVHQPFEEEARGYYAITELGRRYFHDSNAEPEEFVADIDDTLE